MHLRPAVVAFDVIGTLFSLEPLRAPLSALGLPAHALEFWFARTLRNGFALAASGTFHPFSEVARGTLEGVLAESGRPADPARTSTVLEQFSRLPAHADAAPALRRLQDGGVRVFALTNGSEKNTRALLEGAGLREDVRQAISIEEVGAWKPRADVYRYAAEAAGTDPPGWRWWPPTPGTATGRSGRACRPGG